jgi:hypothetical protein
MKLVPELGAEGELANDEVAEEKSVGRIHLRGVGLDFFALDPNARSHRGVDLGGGAASHVREADAGRKADVVHAEAHVVERRSSQHALSLQGQEVRVGVVPAAAREGQADGERSGEPEISSEGDSEERGKLGSPTDLSRTAGCDAGARMRLKDRWSCRDRR